MLVYQRVRVNPCYSPFPDHLTWDFSDTPTFLRFAEALAQHCVPAGSPDLEQHWAKNIKKNSEHKHILYMLLFLYFLGCYWLDFQLLQNSPWFCLCLPHLNHGLTPFWSIGTPFLSSPEAELHHRQASPHVLGGMASTWWNPLLAACFLFRKPSGNSMVKNGQKNKSLEKVAPW